MKVYLTLKFIVCGLVCVFPVDIKGQACKECNTWSGRECKSCDVGCYIVENYWCSECRPECYSCSSRTECDLCQTGLYGPRCNYDCASCRDGSCSNKTCTDGCADGYYHHEEDGVCLQCPNTCSTCNSYSDCTSCIAGRTGPKCQNCKPGYYHQSGKCNQCNTNCLNDTCLDISGNCTDGCKDGWTGWGCIEACGPKCVSCDRHNGTRCTSLDSLQISSIRKGGSTKDTMKSVIIGIFVAVGFVVLVALIVFMKRRKKFQYDSIQTEEDADEHIPENGCNKTGLTRSQVEVGNRRDHVASVDDFDETFKFPRSLHLKKHLNTIARPTGPRTVEDLLGLVVQESCSYIISLDPVGISRKDIGEYLPDVSHELYFEKVKIRWTWRKTSTGYILSKLSVYLKTEDIGEYLPDVSHELYFEKVKIRCTFRNTSTGYKLSKLSVYLKAESTEEPKPIVHCQYIDWPKALPVQSSTSAFLNLVRCSVENARSWKRRDQPEVS